MKISLHIQSKLTKFRETFFKKDDDLNSAIHWVAIGLSLGEITGENEELREFILSHLTDAADLSSLNKYGFTPMSELFDSDSYEACSEEIKQNILFAFRLFFEKNKLSIIKQGHKEPHHQPESAIERICKYPKLMKELEPELLTFITECSPQLSESELHTLIYAIHNNQTLVGHLKSTLLQSNTDSFEFERNSIPALEFKEMISNHWHPECRGKIAYFYEGFPAIEMWRLFMDGDKQISESGWTLYVRREEGCIDKLYKSWKYIQQTIDESLTPQYFKNIHEICADKIASVHGKYRSSKPYFGLSTNTLTFLGYFELISNYAHLCCLETKDGKGFGIWSNISSDQLDTVIISIIEEYESAMCHAPEDPEVQLKIIVEFCKKLELIHPFSDCNGRIFCNVLLNRELVRHGFSPTLLDNPNRLEGHSLKESLYEVVRGMNAFQQLKKEGTFKQSKLTVDLIKSTLYPIEELSCLFFGKSELNPYNYGEEVLLKNVPYEGLYKHASTTEFVLMSKGYNLHTRIECKW